MGPLRWRVALPSWLAIVIGATVAVAATARLVSEPHPFAALMLAGGVALLVPGLLLRIDVGTDGIAVWPTGPRVPWSEIEGFEARGVVLASIRLYRPGRPRPTVITIQPIGARRARRVADRLNDEPR